MAWFLFSPVQNGVFLLLLIASLASSEPPICLSCPSVIFLAKLNIKRCCRGEFSYVSFSSCFLLCDGDGLVRLAMWSFEITSTLWHSGTLLFTLWINSKPKFKYQLNRLKCRPVFSNSATKFPEFLAEWLCYLEVFVFFYTCSNPAVVFVAERSRGVPEVILPFEEFLQVGICSTLVDLWAPNRLFFPPLTIVFSVKGSRYLCLTSVLNLLTKNVVVGMYIKGLGV